MSVHLVIDGYNLIGTMPKSPGAFNDLEGEREGLLAALSVYRRVRGVKVTVVFDGTHSHRLSRNREMHDGVEVIFSKDGEDADSIIKEIARARRDGATVVTSDREIIAQANACGAVTLGSDEFRALLDGALYEDMKGGPVDDEEPERPRKGNSRKPPKSVRKKINRLKKL